MLPVLTPVDDEKALIDVLEPLLAASAWAGVGISNSGGSGTFIRVRRIGGPPMNPAMGVGTLDLVVWHPDNVQRMALANQLWAWCRGMANEQTADAVVTYVGTALSPRRAPDPADPNAEVVLLTVQMVTHPTA